MPEQGPAFRVGGRIDPPYFVDREQSIETLVHDAASLAQSNVIIAPRRFGKTALLYAVQARLAGSLLAPYITGLGTPDPVTLHDRVVEALLDAFEARHGRTRRLLATWRDVLTKPVLSTFERLDEVGGSFAEIGSVRLKFRTKEADPRRLLEATFGFVERFAAEHGENVVLIFDEFQELATFGDLVFPLLKASMDAQRHVTYIFSGSSLSLLADVFGREGKSPLYQMVGRLYLGEIDLATVRTFVRERLRDVHGVVITDGGLEAVTFHAGGIPYYVQKLGVLLERTVLLESRKRLAKADVDAACARMLDELDADFLERWTTRWSDQQRTILRALARAPKTLTEIANHAGVPAENLTYNLRRMQDEMVLTKENGAYRIVDRVFAAWLARL